jgi:hypothetical protein
VAGVGLRLLLSLLLLLDVLVRGLALRIRRV